jgi:6-pyruvoyl-tetrahydropterin synthase-like protein
MKAAHAGSRQFGALDLTVIALTSLAVVLPFWHFGIPSGHDFEFHMNSWLEVAEDWSHGLIYPHWAAWAHYGYGEARFIFYPPFSWGLGAALGSILPWKLVPAAYIWVVLALSGASMFLLARRFFSRADALFAAVFYVANPYHLVIVYWRSAFAELLAAAYLPLLFLYALRSEEDGPQVIAPLSLLLAAGWLTNIPSAVMMNYSIALLLGCVAARRHSFAVLGYGAIAVALGAAIGAVYLIPAWHQQTWVNLDQVLSPGVRPEDSFLFTITPDPDHNQFNRLVSIIAVWELAIAAGAFVLSRRLRRERTWWPLLVWSGACCVLMISLTSPLWRHLPELRFVQFPWRWLLCLNVAVAAAIVLGFRRMWLRIIICVVALGAVLLVWHSVMRPWWDNAGDIQEMVDNQQDEIGNEGVEEYVPSTVDTSDVDQKAPQVRFEGNGAAKVQVVQWRAENRIIDADVSSPGKLVLRLFNYPDWRVEVNGVVEHSETAARTGLMEVPIHPGNNRVHIFWAEGRDRKCGEAISVITLVGLLAWCYARRRRALLGRSVT